MKGRPFTIATFNAFDRGRPPEATIVACQERPPLITLQHALPQYRHFYPDDGSDSISWDPARFRDVETTIRRISRSGRWHGQPNTSPARFMLTTSGLLDGEKVAVINAHLVNNAFGPVKRGERALRLKLWTQGWTAILREKRRLRRLGYRVFVVGDFNRKARYWPSLVRVIGNGYDQLRYPKSVTLMGAWRGERNGSDHHPIIARFRIPNL